MTAYVYRLIPPRATFAFDATDAERATMGAHATYWTDRMNEGNVIGFGPVNDPVASYGLGILVADDDDHARRMVDRDPAITSPHGFTYTLAPMLSLVTPAGTIGPS